MKFLIFFTFQILFFMTVSTIAYYYKIESAVFKHISLLWIVSLVGIQMPLTAFISHPRMNEFLMEKYRFIIRIFHGSQNSLMNGLPTVYSISYPNHRITITVQPH